MEEPTAVELIKRLYKRLPYDKRFEVRAWINWMVKIEIAEEIRKEKDKKSLEKSHQ